MRVVLLLALASFAGCSKGTEALSLRNDTGQQSMRDAGAGSDAAPAIDGGAADRDAATASCPTVTPLCTNGDCRLDVELETVTVSGTASIEGLLPLINCTTFGVKVRFVDRARGETFERTVRAGPFEVELYPGTYDVWAAPICSPVRGMHLVAANRELTASRNHLDISLALVNISGVAAVDGAPFPDCAGFMPPAETVARFVNRARGEELLVVLPAGRTRYASMVYVGSYDVSVVWPICNPARPTGITGEVFIGSRQISAATEVDLVVDAVTVTTHTPQDDEYQLRFADVVTGLSITRHSMSGRAVFGIPRGRYDVFASRDPRSITTGGAEVVIARNWSPEMDPVLEVRADDVELTANITIDGAPLPQICPVSGMPGDGDALLSFQDLSRNITSPRLIRAADSRLAITPGRYDVYFAAENPFIAMCMVSPAAVDGETRIARDLAIGANTAIDARLTTVPVNATSRGQGTCVPELVFADPLSLARQRVRGQGRVYSGTYDVFADITRCYVTGDPFEYRTGEGYVDGMRRLATGVGATREVELDADVTQRRLHGALAFGGDAIPVSDGCTRVTLSTGQRVIFEGSARMSFTNRDSGERFTKYLDGGREYAFDIYPGVYDVGVELLQCEPVPRGREKFALSGERTIGACLEIR